MNHTLSVHMQQIGEIEPVFKKSCGDTCHDGAFIGGPVALSPWHLGALAAFAVIARTRRGRAAKDPSSRSRTSLQLRFGEKHKMLARAVHEPD